MKTEKEYLEMLQEAITGLQNLGTAILIKDDLLEEAVCITKVDTAKVEKLDSTLITVKVN